MCTGNHRLSRCLESLYIWILEHVATSRLFNRKRRQCSPSPAPRFLLATARHLHATSMSASGFRFRCISRPPLLPHTDGASINSTRHALAPTWSRARTGTCAAMTTPIPAMGMKFLDLSAHSSVMPTMRRFSGGARRSNRRMNQSCRHCHPTARRTRPE